MGKTIAVSAIALLAAGAAQARELRFMGSDAGGGRILR